MAKKAQKETKSKSSKQEKSAPAKSNPVETGPAVTNAAVDVPGSGTASGSTILDHDPNAVEQEENVILTIMREGENPQTVSIPKKGATVAKGLESGGFTDTDNYDVSTPEGKKVALGSSMPGNVTVNIAVRKRD